jgi:lysozyme
VIDQTILVYLRPLVQSSEGCKLESYQDVAGVWTIGYGHTGVEVVPGLSWSQAQADTQLDVDLGRAYSQLLQVSPSLQRSSAQRQAALTDFVYNLGIGTYQHSMLRSAVDCSAWGNVCVQLAKWVYAGGKIEQGLVTRRNKEIALVRGG